MEKISGIIPPSARTQVADIASAQPARPGAPALGRPMGKNSLGDRITLSKKMEEMKKTGELPIPESPKGYKDTEENRKLKVIQDLNQRFFSPKSSVSEGDGTMAEEFLNKTVANEGLFVVEEELRPQQSTASSKKPLSSSEQSL